MNPALQLSDLGQIALTVSDVAAAKKFYHQVLGLKLLFEAGPNLTFLAALLERGAKGEHAPKLSARMPDHELWMAFVHDPDGNLVGLMEERAIR